MATKFDYVSEDGSNVISLNPRGRVETTEIESFEQAADLQSMDGGGTSGGMEGRVAKLESDMGHVKDTVKSIDGKMEKVRSDIEVVKVDIGVIKTNLSYLPSKGFIFAVAAGMLAAAGGIMAIVVRFIPHAP